MVKRIVGTLFVLVIAQCVSVKTAAAQSTQASPCGQIYTANALGIDLGVPVPLGAFLIWQNTVAGFGGTSLYEVLVPTCTPSICIDCLLNAGQQPIAGQPIHLATGSTFIQEKDLKIPGLGGGLSLTRTWNSVWPPAEAAYSTGLFGPNWRSTYEEHVYLGSDGYMRYLRGDGSFWSFGWIGYNLWSLAAPQNGSATLSIGSSVWTITFQNGEQRQFSPSSGSLTAIIDPNGNTTQLAYDGLGRLTTVTDPVSRTLTFTYQSPTSFLVTNVSSSTGTSFSYSYNSDGLLTQVTNPDSTTLNFTYNGQSLITSVTDTNGIVLESHTYDGQGRGLTSARANGVEAVAVSY
jgi:YD repeat-containing protein